MPTSSPSSPFWPSELLKRRQTSGTQCTHFGHGRVLSSSESLQTGCLTWTNPRGRRGRTRVSGLGHSLNYQSCPHLLVKSRPKPISFPPGCSQSSSLLPADATSFSWWEQKTSMVNMPPSLTCPSPPSLAFLLCSTGAWVPLADREPPERGGGGSSN